MDDLNQKITETIPVFFFIYNLKKEKIEFVSPQYFEIAKNVESVETPDPLKKSIHQDYHKAFDEFFKDLSDKNHFEGSVELKANEQLEGIEWVELNTFPVREPKMTDVEQVVGHMINITEKKKQYEILKEEKEHISNMLNMMAHDLRAPFNRVHMIAELLEGSLSEEELAKNKIYIDMLRKEGSQSMELIQSLLRLATLKGRASSLDLKTHDLREMVKEAAEQFRTQMEEKELQLHMDFPDASVKAKLDAIVFQQVLANLFSNAIKYTKRGGDVTVRLSYEDTNVVLQVEDTGIGIPEKHQKELFNGQSNFRREGLEGEKSFGLGLFICKEIVKMHQGKICVESQEGKGTTFKITLPFPESSASYY